MSKIEVVLSRCLVSTPETEKNFMWEQ